MVKQAAYKECALCQLMFIFLIYSSLQFPKAGTLVSPNGNACFYAWEHSFLLMGTVVSAHGNARVRP